MAGLISGAAGLQSAHHDAQEQHHKDHCGSRENQPVAANGLLESVHGARRAGNDRLIVEMALNVRSQAIGRLVTAGAVLFQRLHHDPIQVAADQIRQFGRLGLAVSGHRCLLRCIQGLQPGGGPQRLLFPDDSANFIQARFQQPVGLKRSFARQQLIQQHAQRVDVAARVNVQPAQPGLFRAHVGRRADKLLEGREQGLVGQALIGGGFGDAEINDLGHRLRHRGPPPECWKA